MSTCVSFRLLEGPINDRLHDFASFESGRVLIVDAEPEAVLRYLQDRFGPPSFSIALARTGAEAIERVSKDSPNVILLDPHLPDQCGLAVHRQIRNIDPRIPVIFLSMDRSANAAIGAMKQGAYEFLFKPLDDESLRRVVTAAMKVAPTRHGDASATAAPQMHEESNPSLCGTSPRMHEVFKSIGLVASQDVNVLITGESGTGKELVARAIYEHSARCDAPFLALNCAAIPENLLESELFGHEKGAFSGADRRRIGKFEQYNGGTILLDEIGDMPLSLQAKILRLLQEQSFERVGGNQTIRTNVRIIASTHRDLKSWAQQERFRADLYFRLSVFTIHLPPLRERIEDLPTLVQHFLRRYSREMGRDTCGIDREAMERLQRYSWPGNIRELQSILRQALLRSSGEVLLPEFLPSLSPAAREIEPTQVKPARDFDIDDFLRERLGPTANNLYADLHREVDRHSLARVMEYTRGNRQMAAQMLGIARQTLRLKLRESGLHITQRVETEAEQTSDFRHANA